jgi:hypothetical protein
VQTTYDYSTGASPGHTDSRPPAAVRGNLDGNYFLSNALGGDHEFKFGNQYRRLPSTPSVPTAETPGRCSTAASR